MSDNSSLRELLAEYGLEFEELSRSLRIRVDNSMYEEVEEWANKLTGANLSSFGRFCVAFTVQHLRKNKPEIAPALSRAAHGRRKWLRKQNAIARLQRAAMELEKRYDPDYDAAMGEYAKEEGLNWPLKGYQIEPGVDPTLKRVIDRLSVVLERQESASLRDIYKGLSGMSSEEARDAILQLEEIGTVRISGSRETGGAMEIKRGNLPQGD